jgi:hypothetical protein
VDYPLSGYPHEYGVDTNIIFVQRRGQGYHTIRVHAYPLTSLPPPSANKWASNTEKQLFQFVFIIAIKFRLLLKNFRKLYRFVIRAWISSEHFPIVFLVVFLTLFFIKKNDKQCTLLLIDLANSQTTDTCQTSIDTTNVFSIDEFFLHEKLLSNGIERLEVLTMTVLMLLD